MREALLEFDTLVIAKDGTAYRAVACGSPARDGTHRWHGWIEFAPVTGGRVIRTPRETTQRDRADTAMWATGLTPVYLEGALRRALDSGLLASQASSRYPGPGAARPQGHRQRRHRVHTALPAAEPARRSTRSRARAPATGFARVGGMDDLKARIRRIIETVHIRREDARRYGIVRNGILLYGPPGCGKTFFVQAVAEEFGLHLLRVPLARAITKYVGGAPDAIQRLFEEARSRTPCVLFFDEFDALACRRQDTPLLHEQQMVKAMLELFTRKMHLDRSVDLERLAAVTNGASGALLKGLCAVAGRNALVRELDARGIAPVATELPPAVTQGDFERALKELSSASRRRPIGFGDAIQVE